MVRRRVSSALALFASVVAFGAALPGCVCCSIGEYAPQCLNACGQICTDACVPICIDTIRGEGPLNAAAHLSREARQGAPETLPSAPAVAEPASPVAY